MNYPKINMFLLIVVIVGLAVALYFLFINKKDTNAQTEGLLALLKREKLSTSRGGGPDLSVQEEEQTSTTEQQEPAEPTDEDWKMIYAISEKIYFNKPRTKKELEFQKKFDAYIQKDIEFCNEFYPIVEKKVKEEELNGDEQAFYEANKEQVDDEVNSRKKIIIIRKVASEEPLNENEKLLYEQNKEWFDGKVEYPKKLIGLIEKGKEIGFKEGQKQKENEFKKSNPPSTKDEKLKIILGLFEDGIPKSTPQLITRYDKETNSTTGKNLYRFLKTIESEKLVSQKVNDIVYYGLPSWFEGKKLKQEFKDKIA